MWTIDTSIYMRDADPTASHHVACQTLLDTLANQQIPIFVPRLLLAEIAGVVRRLTHDPIRARLAVDALRNMPHVHIVSLTDDLMDTVADIAGDYALRGTDACFVAVAQAYRCTLVTLDREQRERATPIVATMTPADAFASLSLS